MQTCIHHNRSDQQRNQRGGYLYVAVLFVSLIVSMTALSALTLSRHTLRNSVDQRDAMQADLLALSAVDFAANYTRLDSNWRNIYTDDTEYPSTPYSLNSGTFTYKFKDTDGLLNDSTDDACWVYGIGKMADAVAVRKALLLPNGPGMDCLDVAMCCNSSINVPVSQSLETDQTVYSRNNISVGLLGQIDGDAEATGSVTGYVTGTKTSGAPARTFPDPDSLYAYYLLRGTHIPLANLPTGLGGQPQFRQQALSPFHNPYGPTNPEGIYIIDCQGTPVEFSDCRILGTLVLLNATAPPSVKSLVNWEAFVPNYPCLICDGDLSLALTSGDLSELLQNTNFNPSGVPYDGETDSDKLDSYPSQLKGLVCVMGHVSVPLLCHPHVEGNLICQSYAQLSPVTVDFDPAARDLPPPGFRHGPDLELCPGSWQRADVNE